MEGCFIYILEVVKVDGEIGANSRVCMSKLYQRRQIISHRPLSRTRGYDVGDATTTLFQVSFTHVEPRGQKKYLSRPTGSDCLWLELSFLFSFPLLLQQIVP